MSELSKMITSFILAALSLLATLAALPIAVLFALLILLYEGAPRWLKSFVKVLLGLCAVAIAAALAWRIILIILQVSA